MGLLTRVAASAWWWVPLGVTALAFASTVGFDLVADARFLLADNPWIRDIGRLWDNVTHDYFWSASGNTIPYWRPVTKASWVLEYQLFGAWPGGYHLVNVLWHVVGVAGVLALGRRLGLSRPWATVAGLFYGLHPVTGEAACLVMARSDVVAAAASAWALVAWDRWLAGGGRGAILGLALAISLALGSKEVAVALGPVVLVWAWVSGALGDRARRRRLMAGLALIAAFTTLYLVARALVLAGSPRPSVALDPLRLVAGGGRALAGLLPFRLESGVRNLPRAAAAQPAAWLPGAALWAFVLGAGAWAAWRRRAAPALLLAWAVASLAPVLLVATVHVPGASGKIALADRWLLQAAMASSLGWAWWAGRALGDAPSRPWAPRARRALWGAVGLWALAAVVVSPTAHGVYASEAALLAHEDAQLADTPRALWTQEDVCRALDRRLARALAQGRGPEAARWARGAPAACLEEPDFAFNAASAALAGGQAATARALAESLVARRGGDRRHIPRAHVIAGVAAVRQGDLQAGLEHLRAGVAGGVPWCEVGGEVAQALSRLGRHAEAAEALERLGGRCLRGPGAALAWLGAAQEWWQSPPGPGRASRTREALARAARAAPAGSALARQVEGLRARVEARDR